MSLEMALAVGPSLAAELAHVAESLKRSTVQLTVGGRGGGAGVIWKADGIIVTNAHVCSRGRARVSLADGRRIDAEVTACDPQRDLALLRADVTDLPAATIGAADGLRVGELVLAVGSPWGIANALSVGIVHAAGGRWLRADIRLAPGNSGGPLANAGGEVVGVNSMIAGGLGLAVPSGAVERMLRGETRPRLGVRLKPVTVASAAGRAAGLMIVQVEPGSRAEVAELGTGDVIVGIGDRLFASAEELLRHLGEMDVTAPAALAIVRAAKRMTVVIPPPADGRRAAA